MLGWIWQSNDYNRNYFCYNLRKPTISTSISKVGSDIYRDVLNKKTTHERGFYYNFC